MPTVQITSQIDFNEVLNGIAQLPPQELEQFTEKVLALRAKRHAPSLSKNETRLLKKINQGVKPEFRNRYTELNAKLQDKTLTSQEQQEFIALTDQIELADAERMRSLVELAQLRQISVDTLMETLGLRPPLHA